MQRVLKFRQLNSFCPFSSKNLNHVLRISLWLMYFILLLSFFMRFVSFAYLFSLVMTSSQVNKSEKRSLLAVAPSWGEVTQAIAAEHDVSCRFLRDVFYHWGISFHSLFAERFHNEWFEFIKCFSCTYWDLFNGSPYSANVVNYRWSSNVKITLHS